MSGSLEIRDLLVKRGAFSMTIPSLNVVHGEIHVLKGESGSGKSTLLECIAGFLMPDSGSIRMGGVEISMLPPEKRKLGYVFQQSALFPNMNVIDNVAFSLRVMGMSKDKRHEKAKEWLARVGIENHALKRVDQISGGESQRVQFARALIGGWPLLLLDEPFSALDVPLKEELRSLLRRLVKETNVACVLVSHDPEDVKQLADSFSDLKAGKITKSEKVPRV